MLLSQCPRISPGKGFHSYECARKSIKKGRQIERKPICIEGLDWTAIDRTARIINIFDKGFVDIHVFLPDILLASMRCGCMQYGVVL